MTLAEAYDTLLKYGRKDLAEGMMSHYETMAFLSNGTYDAVRSFCDGVLDNFMITTDPLTAEDVLLSPDFAPLKAAAREIQRLDEEAGPPEIDIILE